MPFTNLSFTGIDPDTCGLHDPGQNFECVVRVFWNVPVYEIQQSCLKAFDKAKWELEYQRFVPQFSSLERVIELHVLCRKTVTALASNNVQLAVKFLQRYADFSYRSRFYSRVYDGQKQSHYQRESHNHNRAIVFATQLFTKKKSRWNTNPLYNKTTILKLILSSLWKDEWGYGNERIKKLSVDGVVWRTVFARISTHLKSNFFEKEGVLQKDAWRQLEMFMAHAMNAPRFPMTALPEIVAIAEQIKSGEVKFEEDQSFGFDFTGYQAVKACELFLGSQIVTKFKNM